MEISEKLAEDIKYMVGEHEELKTFASSVNGTHDIFIKETLEEIYTDILEFLPDDLMEKVVEKFDARWSEVLDKIEKLEETIDIDSSIYFEFGDIADRLDWARLGVEK